MYWRNARTRRINETTITMKEENKSDTKHDGKPTVCGSGLYSEREIDFAYLAGVFNVSGIDGLQKEIERLKGLGKNPHDLIIAAREQ